MADLGLLLPSPSPTPNSESRPPSPYGKRDPRQPQNNLYSVLPRKARQASKNSNTSITHPTCISSELPVLQHKIVWVDLSGPADVELHTGNKYIMNTVDDYLSFIWSIPLKTKDQAHWELVSWQLACENETGLKLWKYCTDNGELKNNELDKWLQYPHALNELYNSQKRVRSV